MPLHVTALICSTVPVQELHQLDPPCRAYHPHIDLTAPPKSLQSSTPREAIRKESILRQEALYRQEANAAPFSRTKKNFKANDNAVTFNL
jgi:hypothetical protein